MNSDRESDIADELRCDVAIVGAGPVGATLAALLGQAGLSVFIGETSRAVYPLPRAAHFDHEVMRIFQQLGITDAIMGSITPVERYVFQNAGGDILLEFNLTEPADSGWQGYMIHQPGIENALRARLAGDRRVDFRTGIGFGRCEAAGDHVTSYWQGDTGTLAVSSSFLVGCDGAWSPVREGAGIGFDDLQFDEPWLVLDVLVDQANGLPAHNIQYCDPARPTTYVVMGNNRRRFEFMLLPGEAADTMLEDATIAQLLAPWSTLGVQSVERKAVYRFHALVADRWRAGRVLIAGDAAHQMPPFAGQGMCSGIRDAAALAWRLPLALSSGDNTMLLDSYQAERDPHVRTITEAAVATGRVVCTLDPVLASGRDAHMLASMAAGEPMPDISSPAIDIVFGLPATPCAGQRFFQPWAADTTGTIIRLDDVLGLGAWLIARDPVEAAQCGDAIGVRVFNLASAPLAPFRAALERWLESADRSAVLVRGDRYVFGTGEASGLFAAFKHLTGQQCSKLEI